MSLPKMYTTEELAEILKKTTKTLETWRSRGFGPRFIKTGKNVFYAEEDVANWLASQTRASVRHHKKIEAQKVIAEQEREQKKIEREERRKLDKAERAVENQR